MMKADGSVSEMAGIPLQWRAGRDMLSSGGPAGAYGLLAEPPGAGPVGYRTDEPEADPAAALPARRSDLLLRPSADDGRHVVKDLRSGRFFELGPQEAFLLQCLDGRRTAADLS